MGDLDCSQGLDVHVGKSRFEPAKHLAVIGKARFHVETADDVKFLRQSAGSGRGLGEYLVESVMIRAFFLRQSREGAEHARLPQVADVGRIDVLIGGESDYVTVLAAVGVIGEHADGEQVRRCKEQHGVGLCQASLTGDFLAIRPQPAIMGLSSRSV